MAIFDEKIIKITDYKVVSELPDPFLRSDGTRVKNAEEFETHKAELYRSAVEIQYGTMPPEPELLEVERLDMGKKVKSFRIITGRRAHPVSFTMRVYLVETEGKAPVIVDGDMGFDYFADKEWRAQALDNGIGLALFNRTELVPDCKQNERKGPLYECYPEYDFSALGAWAWGYARCVDALEMLDIFDMDWVTFTGHSRGGKTALLAGVLDKRARIVVPNDSGAGGCGCYRVHMKAINENGEEKREEPLSVIYKVFPYWFGTKMEQYIDREEELPFDEHFLKALVAPRTLIVAEAASDIWANPIGSLMTTRAAGEVYKLYGKEENLYWYFRYGEHAHKAEDLAMTVSVIKHQRDGEPLCEGFFSTPFEEPEEPIVDHIKA